MCVVELLDVQVLDPDVEDLQFGAAALVVPNLIAVPAP
jgi:hypothetical protein